MSITYITYAYFHINGMSIICRLTWIFFQWEPCEWEELYCDDVNDSSVAHILELSGTEEQNAG